MNNEIIETIKYHIKNRMYITVERVFENELNSVSGFPLIITDKYLLMTVIADFHDEGYTILKIDILVMPILRRMVRIRPINISI